LGCLGRDILKLPEVHPLRPQDFVSYELWIEKKDPFKVLVGTILSQNSTDKSAFKAFKSLEEKVGVTPQALVGAPLDRIEQALRVSGLYRSKAMRLKQISEILLQSFGGDLQKILVQDMEKARELLISMPGVGEKTADVVLLTCSNAPLFPVDTHIRRIAIRLGLANEKDTYSKISTKLMSILPRDSYLIVHLAMIQHGRTICKAVKPLCDRCPLSNCCEYARAQVGEPKESPATRRHRSSGAGKSKEGSVGN